MPATAIVLLCGLTLTLTGAATMAQELVSEPDDRSALSLTLYQNDLGLVRDSRRVQLLPGISSLAFSGVSAQLRPATAHLYGEGMQVLAQNFDYDLLTPQRLLERSVGQEIGVIRTHPVTGDELEERAILLAVVEGQPVLRIDNRIETAGQDNPWRFVFDDLPEGLRERPTLSLDLEVEGSGIRDLTLAYLTGGLSWQADYLATLSPDEQSLDLVAWATLRNDSGADYPDARVQLLAGEVNQETSQADGGMVRMAAMAESAAPPMEEQTLSDYHLYTLERPVSLPQHQAKQVLMFQADDIPVVRHYQVSAPPAYFRLTPGEQELPVRTLLKVDNRDPALGRPLPAGMLRVYRPDNRGLLQFIGESRTGAVPEGRTLEATLGHAFDVTATRRQTDFQRVGRDITESAFEVELFNAKDQAVEVEVLEQLSGDWRIIQESQPHTRRSAHQVAWTVRVPAQGSATLSYRVRSQ